MKAYEDFTDARRGRMLSLRGKLWELNLKKKLQWQQNSDRDNWQIVKFIVLYDQTINCWKCEI